MKFCQGVLLVPKNESHIFPATNKAVPDDIIIFESEKVFFSIKKQGSLLFENSFGGEDGCQARLKNGRGTCNVLKLSHESWFW